jgi:hypothetical protein
MVNAILIRMWCPLKMNLHGSFRILKLEVALPGETVWRVIHFLSGTNSWLFVHLALKNHRSFESTLISLSID